MDLGICTDWCPFQHYIHIWLFFPTAWEERPVVRASPMDHSTQVEVVAASKAWTASPMPELYSYQPARFHLEDAIWKWLELLCYMSCCSYFTWRSANGFWGSHRSARKLRRIGVRCPCADHSHVRLWIPHDARFPLNASLEVDAKPSPYITLSFPQCPQQFWPKCSPIKSHPFQKSARSAWIRCPTPRSLRWSVHPPPRAPAAARCQRPRRPGRHPCWPPHSLRDGRWSSGNSWCNWRRGDGTRSHRCICLWLLAMFGECLEPGLLFAIFIITLNGFVSEMYKVTNGYQWW